MNTVFVNPDDYGPATPAPDRSGQRFDNLGIPMMQDAQHLGTYYGREQDFAAYFADIEQMRQAAFARAGYR